jgi:DNA-binding GntR family transcriptional regulator
MKTYELSRGTVRQAIKTLRDEGIVTVLPQRGNTCQLPRASPRKSPK